MIKRSALLLITFFLIPTAFAITCDFSGWNVPKLSPDNTIVLDGDLWQAYDQNLGTAYTREIIKVGTENDPIVVDESLTEQDYLNIANDFLERNEAQLDIEEYTALELDYDGSYPIVKFLGENQVCYDYYVIGSFAGAVKFTENRVYSLYSKWYKPVEIDDNPPAINEQTATATAGDGGGGGGGGGGEGKAKPELAILPLANDTFRLVWDVELENETHVYVDAHTGDILDKEGRLVEERIMRSPSKKSFDKRILIAAIATFIIIFLGLVIWKKGKK